jgi:hypothetical protein
VPVTPGTHDIECLTWACEGCCAWTDCARALLWRGGGALRVLKQERSACAGQPLPAGYGDAGSGEAAAGRDCQGL